MKGKELHDQALNEILESTLDIEDMYITPKESALDYAQAGADGFTKAMTVVSVSVTLAGKLVVEELRKRK